MPKLLDVPVEALAQVVMRHLGLGLPCAQAPAICRSWLTDFRDTLGDPKIKPIQTLYRAHPFRGRTPFEGQASYPMFAIWRSKAAWKWFTNATDEEAAAALFMWVLPSEVDTERVWPLLEHFGALVRRVFEHAPEELDDYEILSAAGVTEWAVELKMEMGFAGPGGIGGGSGGVASGQLLFPTLSGAFTFKSHWTRNEHNLGLEPLPIFDEVLTNYMLKGVGQDGDVDPIINPILRGLHKPKQP